MNLVSTAENRQWKRSVSTSVTKGCPVLTKSKVRPHMEPHRVAVEQCVGNVHRIVPVRHCQTFLHRAAIDVKSPHRRLPVVAKLCKDVSNITLAMTVGEFRPAELNNTLFAVYFLIETRDQD